MDIFAAPEFWLGMGTLLVMAVILLSHGNTNKKMIMRLERVTRKSHGLSTHSAAESLRRLKPQSNSAIWQIIASMRSIAKLQARLELAGVTQTTPQKFLMIVAAIMIATPIGLLIFLGKPLEVGVPIGVLLGLALPHFFLNRKIKKRQLAFLLLFPDAIDLMVRGLRAGLPIAESFVTVSKELSPPISEIFAIVSQQTQLGMPMEKALSDAAGKLDLSEFNFFVTTIILQRETGGNLSEILNNLADMLRQRHMMKMKIGALASEARASAYIIGALPFLVFTILEIFSPDYLRPLFDDPRGHKALAAAFTSLGTGVFIMKRMTQLEI